MSKQIPLRPDTARSEYRPGDEIVFTLIAHQTDMLNLEDSYCMALCEFSSALYYDEAVYAKTEGLIGTDRHISDRWDPLKYTMKTLALGGASFIDRIIVNAGTTQLQDSQRYNIWYGTVATMEMTPGIGDPETLLGISSLAWPYTGPFIYQHEIQASSVTSYKVWVKIPILTILNEVGFIPTFQTQNRLKLHLHLAREDAVWKNCQYGTGAGWGEEEWDHVYPGYRELHDEYLDGEYLFSGIPTLNYYDFLDVDVLNTHTQAYYCPVFSWKLLDIVLLVKGLAALNSGALNPAPMDVFTEAYKLIEVQTNGQASERIPMQIKKSSISGFHAVFIDPKCFTSQAPNRLSIDQWTRAGRLGAKDTTYDPSIVWWALELGGHMLPTPTGAGMRSPPSRDYNCPLWYHEYQRYTERNNIAGSTFPAALSPWDESTSSYFRNHHQRIGYHAAELNEGGLLGDGRSYTLLAQNVLTLTPDTEIWSHPFAWQTSYAGLTESLYGGPAIRGILDRLSTSIVPATTTPCLYSSSQLGVVPTTALTGGKFIIACTLATLDNGGPLIQGIDTNRYDFNLLIERNQEIDEGKYYQSAWDTPSTYGLVHTMYEAKPRVLAFFKYNVRLIIANGVFTVEDYFHFLGQIQKAGKRFFRGVKKGLNRGWGVAKKGLNIVGNVTEKIMPFVGQIAEVSPKAAAALTGIDVITSLGDDADTTLERIRKSGSEHWERFKGETRTDLMAGMEGLAPQGHYNIENVVGRAEERARNVAESFRQTPDVQRLAAEVERFKSIGQRKRERGVPTRPISEVGGLRKMFGGMPGVHNPTSQGIYGDVYN